MAEENKSLDFTLKNSMKENIIFLKKYNKQNWWAKSKNLKGINLDNV